LKLNWVFIRFELITNLQVGFMHFKRTILLLVISTQSILLQAQSVGLVLSGGGAKGLVHIGVIKALEENGIPIDYIAGTSMGAIVGALYSIGYTPEQMFDLVQSPEFMNWATGEIEDKYIYYFKKPEPDASWLELKFSGDEGGKLKLPLGLVPTSQIDLAFVEIMSGADALYKYNFDSLLVPFRCVASDITNSRAVVFKSGSLPQAVRASMTFPFYFEAIKIDSNLYVDGGLYNNFPVDVMIEEFNPDIIIGVVAANNYEKPFDDDLLLQVERMMKQKYDYSVPAENGILLKPFIGDVGVMDFDKAPELLKSGYREANSRMDEIKLRIRRRVSKEKIQRDRDIFREQIPSIIFDKIYIEGGNKNIQEYVRNSIRQNDMLVSFEQLKEVYFKLIADEHIASLYPRAVYNPETHYFDLYLKVKPTPKFKAEVGGKVSTNTTNQVFGSVHYSLLRKRAWTLLANIYTGRFYNSGFIKGRVDFPFTKPFYIDVLACYNRFDYFRSSPDLFFEDARPSYFIRNESYTQINSGIPVQTNSRFSMGIMVAHMNDRYYQTDIFKKSDEADKTDFDFTSVNFTYEFNTLNKKQYAYEGRYLLFQLKQIDGTEKFTPGTIAPVTSTTTMTHDWIRFKTVFDKYYDLGKDITLGVYAEGVFSTQGLFQNYFTTIIFSSAFNPTPNSYTIFMRNYYAQNYLAVGFKPILRISDNLHARLEAYYFQPFQRIKKVQGYLPDYYKPFDHRSLMAIMAMVYYTPFGPATLSINYFDKEIENFYFQFSFGYTIFNRRALD
jgi:NTE family protein